MAAAHLAGPGLPGDGLSDTALTTQLDERGVPTSPSSQPSIMLAMLEVLDVSEGHRVLELGTGTGYIAALLCHRLGDANVTSIDIDPDLVDTAAQRLHQAGFNPTVAVRDGEKGHPGNAPCDRMISTAGLHAIPKPLLQQAALGAVIVAPIGYGIARVIVTAPGHATGRFLTVPAHFMARRTGGSGPQFDAALEQSPTGTSVPPADLLRRLKFPASLALSGYRSCSWRTQDGDLDAVGLWTPDGSTVIAHTSGSVRQIGPQKLWDTVEDLAKIFGDEPERDAFLLAVTPTRQTVFYEDTDGPSWALPATF
ncbi:methyltransferase domain-containing protein [Streptomyces sp. NBC_00638]|uniref:methyltransferase domain-containing protein n=1 Tax=unclassified Streptomyces TaxID=2593676 RepID=UPI00224F1D12|nr:methyltransferase domain-containing protein [Streptomyces sp. NBC_00638]MCX5008588.1 methyltransferase domain-containing protein [Streptomyces sp. NBC_00638]